MVSTPRKNMPTPKKQWSLSPWAKADVVWMIIQEAQRMQVNINFKIPNFHPREVELLRAYVKTIEPWQCRPHIFHPNQEDCIVSWSDGHNHIYLYGEDPPSIDEFVCLNFKNFKPS